jgi:Holliday junction resolvase RusA-like endonuclease
MSSIKFTIPCVAVQERARKGKHGHWYDPSAKLKKDIGYLILEARQGQQLLGGDLAVYITCIGKDRFDVDNSVKLILDAANTIAYADDDQVCLIIARKIRIGEERMEVEIMEMEP